MPWFEGFLLSSCVLSKLTFSSYLLRLHVKKHIIDSVLPKLKVGRRWLPTFIFCIILPKMLFSAINMGLSMYAMSSRVPTAKSELGCKKS